MGQTTRIEQAPFRLRLAWAVGFSLLSGGSAAARHVPNGRATGLDDPATGLHPHTTAGTFAPPAGGVAASRAKAAPPPDAGNAYLGKRLAPGAVGVGTTTVVIVDNHGIDYHDPAVAGPGAPPKHERSSVTVPAPGQPGCPLVFTRRGHVNFYYLPFSTDLFPGDTNRNPSAKYGYGLYVPPFGAAISGSLPQSALPLGMPVAPDEPTFSLTELREAVVSLVSLVDTPAAQAIRASIQERDVHVAMKYLPRPSGAGREPRG